MANPTTHTGSVPTEPALAESTVAILLKTLLDLSTEIRLQIYDWVFYSTTLEASREDSDLEADAQTAQDEANQEYAFDMPVLKRDVGDDSATGAAEAADGLDGSDEDSIDRYDRAGSTFTMKEMSEKLNLVRRVFNEEIGQSWRGKVTYDFPCTVAFIDVVSQWSPCMLEAVRHVHVCAYPIPLYPYDRPDCYTTHFFADALPI